MGWRDTSIFLSLFFTRGAPPPPHCLLLVSSSTPPRPRPPSPTCTLVLASISLHHRGVPALVTVVAGVNQSIQNGKTNLLFIHHSKGHSLLIIPPQTDPHAASLHSCCHISIPQIDNALSDAISRFHYRSPSLTPSLPPF